MIHRTRVFLTPLLCILFAVLLKADIVPPRECIQEAPLQALIRLMEDPDRQYHLDELQQFAQKMGATLNGTLIIARNDTILVERGFGQLQLFKETQGYPTVTSAQLGTLRSHPGNQMQPDALFELASVSKQFTAAAILKLCAEGKMHLNDRLCDFLPTLPYPNVTIKQLLTHTSGIPEYFNFKYEVYDNNMFVDNAQLVRVLERQRYSRTFAPGARYDYTNTNYALLATMVEIVSGQTFAEYVHEHIFAPAGMEHTLFFTELVGADAEHETLFPTVRRGDISASVPPRAETVEVPVTRGHWKNGTLALYDRLNGVLGDKGVYSTAEDLVKWANAYFIEHTILPAEWVEAAARTENTLSDGSTPKSLYGYGLHIEESPAHGTLVYHGGLWNGYQNVFLYRPKDHLIIVFLSNYYNAAHRGKNETILSIFDQTDTTTTP